MKNLQCMGGRNNVKGEKKGCPEARHSFYRSYVLNGVGWINCLLGVNSWGMEKAL